MTGFSLRISKSCGAPLLDFTISRIFFRKDFAEDLDGFMSNFPLYFRMFCPVYGEIVEENGRLTTTGAKRTGCMFCMFGVHLEKKPNRFQRMALTHPKQYDFCIHKLGCGKVLDFLGVPYAPNGGEPIP